MRVSEAEWAGVKSRLPLGTSISGRVAAHRLFGFFVELEQFEGVSALIEIPEYALQLGRPAHLEDFPPIGAEVRGVVLDHADDAQQIRLTRVEQCTA